MKALIFVAILLGFINSNSLLKAQEVIEENSGITFDIRDINGNTYHIVDKKDGLEIDKLKGKIVFLSFFGHRCPPCMMEVPEFINFTNNEKYSNKAVILAFEVQGLRENGLRQFVQYKGINYRVVPGMKYKNFIDYIGYRTGWNFGIPFMVVLDPNGKVVDYGNGIVSEEELKSLADELYVENNTTIQTPSNKENNKQNSNAIDSIIDMISGKNKQ